jgi:heme/copper-type cytochrome/quinol oxidase subunit 1
LQTRSIHLMKISNIKVYTVFWTVSMLMLCIGLILNTASDSTFDLNVHDTYFVIANLHLAIALSVVYYLQGVGYWILQKAMKRKLIFVLTMIHSVILIGSFVFYWLLLGYTNVCPKRSFPLYDDYILVNQSVMLLLLLIVIIGFPAYIVNITIGIFRKRDLTNN